MGINLVWKETKFLATVEVTENRCRNKPINTWVLDLSPTVCRVCINLSSSLGFSSFLEIEGQTPPLEYLWQSQAVLWELELNKYLVIFIKNFNHYWYMCIAIKCNLPFKDVLWITWQRGWSRSYFKAREHGWYEILKCVSAYVIICTPFFSSDSFPLIFMKSSAVTFQPLHPADAIKWKIKGPIENWGHRHITAWLFLVCSCTGNSWKGQKYWHERFTVWKPCGPHFVSMKRVNWTLIWGFFSHSPCLLCANRVLWVPGNQK